MDGRLIRRLLAATGLTCLVAVGAGGASAWAPLRLGRPQPMALVVVLAAAVTLGLLGAWAVASVLARRDGASASVLLGAAAPRRLIPGALVAVALVALLGISRLDLGTAAPETQARRRGGQGQPIFFGDTRNSPVKATGKVSPTPSVDRSPVSVAAALLVLLAGGAALWWWWGGKRTSPDAEEPSEGIDTMAARRTVLRSIEAMLSDPDPNTAVIGAYARLLEGLAASGVPRRDYEAPLEHLQRALTHLRVRAGPIRRLVDLFEVARFSTTSLTVEHRDEAIEALREVASDLGGEAVGASGALRSAMGTR